MQIQVTLLIKVSAIQNIFLTPYFMLLNTPAIFDSFVWLLPSICSRIVRPFINYILFDFLRKKKFIKSMIVLQILQSIIGLIILGNSDKISMMIGKRDFIIMLCGVFGYLLIDFSCDNLNLILEDFQYTRQESKKIYYSRQLGKICGYFLGSFWCMGIEINFLLKFESNLRFIFFIQIFLFNLLLCRIFNFIFYYYIFSQTNIRRQTYRNNNCKKSFKTNRKVQLILLSYFFAQCAVYQTIMYGTAWVGLMLARKEPPNATVFLRRKVFEIGVSWGSFTYMFSALMTFICEQSFQKMKMNILQIFTLTQFLGGISLCIVKIITQIEHTFIILILGGFQIASTQEIPKQIIQTKYPQYLNFHNKIIFYSQIFVFGIFPIIKNFFYYGCESSIFINVNLMFAGSFALISGIISLLT